MLILRGIDFGKVLIASGALNFFGGKRPWPYHRYFEKIPGFDFTGATFVSKTTTFLLREGNMPLDRCLRPTQFRPDCICVSYHKGVVLNAVGLSGPGLGALLETGKWQGRKDPFFISFMAVGAEKEDRLGESYLVAMILKANLPFKAPIGLQINISCPNTAHDPKELAEEAIEYLKIFSDLNVPLDLKINALISVETIKKIASTGLVDSVTISNTIPWGQLPERINWKGLFGSDESPLAKYGGGGLSGAPLLLIVGEWVARARSAGIGIPIVAGGGILKPRDIAYLSDCGADAFAIGSVAILRPWNVQRIIRFANQ